MEIIFNKTHKHGDYKTFEIEVGKKEVHITIGPNDINVVVNNASHRAWGGMGKYFESFEQAADAYKSAAVKEAIMTAKESHHAEIFGAA